MQSPGSGSARDRQPSRCVTVAAIVVVVLSLLFELIVVNVPWLKGDADLSVDLYPVKFCYRDLTGKHCKQWVHMGEEPDTVCNMKETFSSIAGLSISALILHAFIVACVVASIVKRQHRNLAMLGGALCIVVIVLNIAAAEVMVQSDAYSLRCWQSSAWTYYEPGMRRMAGPGFGLNSLCVVLNIISAIMLLTYWCCCAVCVHQPAASVPAPIVNLQPSSIAAAAYSYPIIVNGVPTQPYPGIELLPMAQPVAYTPGMGAPVMGQPVYGYPLPLGGQPLPYPPAYAGVNVVAADGGTVSGMPAAYSVTVAPPQPAAYALPLAGVAPPQHQQQQQQQQRTVLDPESHPVRL